MVEVEDLASPRSDVTTDDEEIDEVVGEEVEQNNKEKDDTVEQEQTPAPKKRKRKRKRKRKKKSGSGASPSNTNALTSSASTNEQQAGLEQQVDNDAPQPADVKEGGEQKELPNPKTVEPSLVEKETKESSISTVTTNSSEGDKSKQDQSIVLPSTTEIQVNCSKIDEDPILVTDNEQGSSIPNDDACTSNDTSDKVEEVSIKPNIYEPQAEDQSNLVDNGPTTQADKGEGIDAHNIPSLDDKDTSLIQDNEEAFGVNTSTAGVVVDLSDYADEEKKTSFDHEEKFHTSEGAPPGPETKSVQKIIEETSGTENLTTETETVKTENEEDLDMAVVEDSEKSKENKEIGIHEVLSEEVDKTDSITESTRSNENEEDQALEVLATETKSAEQQKSDVLSEGVDKTDSSAESTNSNVNKDQVPELLGNETKPTEQQKSDILSEEVDKKDLITESIKSKQNEDKVSEVPVTETKSTEQQKSEILEEKDLSKESNESNEKEDQVSEVPVTETNSTEQQKSESVSPALEQKSIYTSDSVSSALEIKSSNATTEETPKIEKVASQIEDAGDKNDLIMTVVDPESNTKGKQISKHEVLSEEVVKTELAVDSSESTEVQVSKVQGTEPKSVEQKKSESAPLVIEPKSTKNLKPAFRINMSMILLCFIPLLLYVVYTSPEFNHYLNATCAPIITGTTLNAEVEVVLDAPELFICNNQRKRTRLEWTKMEARRKRRWLKKKKNKATLYRLAIYDLNMTAEYNVIVEKDSLLSAEVHDQFITVTNSHGETENVALPWVA